MLNNGWIIKLIIILYMYIIIFRYIIVIYIMGRNCVKYDKKVFEKDNIICFVIYVEFKEKEKKLWNK